MARNPLGRYEVILAPDGAHWSGRLVRYFDSLIQARMFKAHLLIPGFIFVDDLRIWDSEHEEVVG